MTQGPGIIINKGPDLTIVIHYHERYATASSINKIKNKKKEKNSFFNIVFVAIEINWKYIYCKHLLLHTAFVQ